MSTCLYRLYDETGRLLYVGIAGNSLIRLGQHLTDKAWATDVASVRIEWHSTREAACAAEIAAITTERPQHNVTHNDRVLALAALRGHTEAPRALRALRREQIRLAGRRG